MLRTDGPNIAHTILSAPATFSAIPLKGLLVGNGCWGGDATTVECNGPNSDQNDVELYHGKGLMSQTLYRQIQATCEWPDVTEECEALLEQSSREVGPHNVYDICARAALPCPARAPAFACRPRAHAGAACARLGR